ncbi:GTP 3',8-cyclase MoaA [Comamonas koreensis]|uniref:GTP 3',8-cyclase n=2 Tax=Comamonas koreensis TaxID=160825 RepID=A0AAW4Y025_9BURK|nr:GTP 3',8-cyclase MoaA [Comamonas koreensis]MCD2166593.1 GTP 3',8-cyclase MoaA [Comamonas koreensis]
MDRPVISLVDLRRYDARLAMPTPAGATLSHGSAVRDQRQRPLRDLRISVTDRCNFRCSYCMPKDVFDKDHQYLPHRDLLSFEEITRTARLFAQLGVGKLRITGGEPLLRKNLEALIAQLAQIDTLDGSPMDLTLTTNGSILARKAQALKDAGLKRLTVSLDSLSDPLFRQMNDMDFPVATVLEGIETAQAVGFANIKVNMVVKRGVNDHEVIAMARHFRGSGVTLRFIEFMDVGATNGWRLEEVLPSDAVLERLQSAFALTPLSATAPGETAVRWGYVGANGQHDPSLGEIGLISSVTHAFCQDCNRARLSTEGKLFLCLFASEGWDLRAMLRNGASDSDLRQAIAQVWGQRSDNYSEQRSQHPEIALQRQRVEMSYIGG